MESMKLWDEEDKVEFEKKLKSLLNVVGAAGTIGTVWFASYTKKQKGIINAKVSCRVRKIPQIIDDPSGRSGKVAHSQNVTEFQVILSNLGNANLLVTELEVEIEKDCKFNLIMSNPKSNKSR